MGITSGSTMTSRSVSFTASHTHDSAMDFKKGIKCDPTLFMTFKLDKQWVAWQHSSTLAQVCAQDVTDVLDLAYHLASPDDQLLFNESRRICMWSLSKNFRWIKARLLLENMRPPPMPRPSNLLLLIITPSPPRPPLINHNLAWICHVFCAQLAAKNHFSNEWKLIMLQKCCASTC